MQQWNIRSFWAPDLLNVSRQLVRRQGFLGYVHRTPELRHVLSGPFTSPTANKINTGWILRKK